MYVFYERRSSVNEDDLQVFREWRRPSGLLWKKTTFISSIEEDDLEDFWEEDH